MIIVTLWLWLWVLLLSLFIYIFLWLLLILWNSALCLFLLWVDSWDSLAIDLTLLFVDYISILIVLFNILLDLYNLSLFIFHYIYGLLTYQTSRFTIELLHYLFSHYNNLSVLALSNIIYNYILCLHHTNLTLFILVYP